MRNGIYRSWFRGEKTQGASAIILVDGTVISCDPTHTYYGTYTAAHGRFHADVDATCHTQLPHMAALSDRDAFHFTCDGAASEETATIACRIAGQSDVTIEMIWIGEM